MRLIPVIISHDDAGIVTQALTKKGFSSTKLATTGGFLMAGNVTILIGMGEEGVRTIIDIARECSHSRKRMIPTTTEVSHGYYPPTPMKVVMGDTTIFVMDIERFKRVRVFVNLAWLTGNTPLRRQLELETARWGLPHAYILGNPAGSGKRTLAGPLAAALVCDRRGGTLSCLSCAGCRKAEGGIHPDIVWVGDNGKDISVVQVRAPRADAYIRPSKAERKVYILGNAQTTNVSVQNAMLKLLGKGPAYAAFLLLTDNAAALLLTVCSRYEYLLLFPITRREAELWLDERYPDQPQAARQAVADRCESLLGRAAAELEGQAADDTQALDGTLELVCHLAGGDELALLEHYVAPERWDREQLRALLDGDVLLLRDALVCPAGTLWESDPRRREAAERAIRTLSPRQFTQAMGVLERLCAACGSNVGAGRLAGWLGATLSTL